MAGKRGRHRGGRTTPKGTHRPGDARRRDEASLGWDGPELVPEPEDGGSDLMADVASALATGEPIDLLTQVSPLLSALDPRSRHPFAASEHEGDPPTVEELVGMFTEVDERETTAILAVVAELTTNEVLAARARRTVASRAHRLPAWLSQLGAAQVGRAVEMVHVYGDGDNVMMEVVIPGGPGPDHRLTALTYIDHNLGTVAKDGYLVPGPVDEVVELSRRHDSALRLEGEAAGDVEWRDLKPGLARARVTEAIDAGALMFPPLESDSWPAMRPLAEWVARLAPGGGIGYVRPEWSDADLSRLGDAFLSSPEGQPLADDPDHAQLLETLLWFGTDYGPGDPLRWSPTSVEILLADWIPRKVVAPAPYLAKAPAVLRAFIAYAGVERGLRAGLIDETLAAVDLWEDDYQKAIRSPRPQGPAALLAAMGVGGMDEWWDPEVSMRAALVREVGSEAALDSLDTRPLPDEDFSWTGVPPDIHAKVGEILQLCDRCCDELLDVEHRTAARRLLALVAANGPDALRRKGRSDTAAAAICWSVARANESFGTRPGTLRVKDLVGHFGLAQGSVSSRAATLLAAAGLVEDRYDVAAWDLALGDPALLVSARRRRIIERRDRLPEG